MGRKLVFILLAVVVSLLLVVGADAFVLPIVTGRSSGLGSFFSSISPAVNRQPQPQDVAKDFFQLWNDGKYDEMYALLSADSQNQYSQDRFVTRYKNVASVVGIKSVTAEVKAPSQQNSSASTQAVKTATVPYSVAIDIILLGTVNQENNLPMVLEGDKWKIQWSPDFIFNGLTDDNRVNLITSNAPRADIVDRKGKPLATSGKTVSVGLVPGNIKDENKVLTTLSSYLGMKPEVIKAQYANAKPDWWVPLKDLPIDKQADATAKLGGIPGIEVRQSSARAYPNGSLAAHVIGYMSEISADELKNLAAKGYEEGDVIGKAGIEASMEETLAGQKGARLAIVDLNGKTIKVIGEKAATPGKTVQLTIDIGLQGKAEQALGDKVGSMVVMDPRDNSILALVSHPAYDPTNFILGLSAADWQRLSQDKTLPFQNRAALSAYPTGSIFKVITMAAGMESAGYSPTSQFNSPGQWTLPGTNQQFADSLPAGHGQINTVDGLAQSANDVFYEMAFKLNSLSPNLLPDMGKSFGLGQPTGVIGMPEAAGTLPTPDWKQSTKNDAWYAGDAVNLSIGQGYFTATPLQMANVYSTLASGGSLRTPLLVKKTGDTATAMETKGKVPVSQATLDAIRQGMKRAASDPKGTAYDAFKGFNVPIAAKTGTAENNQSPQAHAWFASYAPADNPEVVTIVMVEGGNSGSQVAAPIARKFLEGYFAK